MPWSTTFSVTRLLTLWVASRARVFRFPSCYQCYTRRIKSTPAFTLMPVCWALTSSRSSSHSHEPTSWSMPQSRRNTSYFCSSSCLVRRFQRFTAVLATTGMAKPIISARHHVICVQPRTHSYQPPELKGWLWRYLRCRRMNMFSKSSRTGSHRPRK